MLCVRCNFERVHPDVEYHTHRYNKAKEKKEKRIQNMKSSLIKTSSHSVGSLCSILGCTNEVSFSRKDGLCLYHSNIKKKNKKHKEKSISKKTGNKIKSNQQISEKAIKQKMSSIKKEAKIKHGSKCEGCLKSFSNLDYSHILSVGQHKSLELEENNKNLLCRPCHIKWESRDANKMISLACFNNNMKYIRKFSSETFWKIYFIFNDSMMFKECKEIELIDEEFKNNE